MTEYKIKLDVFEGPFDLLLHLIKEEELNIYDIPISRITQQYFEYLEMMKQLNMDIAGEFLVMASTLVYIKSRMLLPSPPATDEDDSSGEDPREELVRRLIEYKKFKDAASTLREKESIQSNTFSREFISEWDEDDADYLKEVSVFQLLSILQKALKATGKPNLYEVALEDVSVTEKMNELMETLESTPKVLFLDLFTELTGRMEIIGTFLAILELIKQQMIRAYQQEGAIWIQKNVEDGLELVPLDLEEQTPPQAEETQTPETGKE